jgi:hypothetical protein
LIKQLRASLVSIGLTLAVSPAQAVTVAGDPADYLIPPVTPFDGVAEIRFGRQSSPGQDLSCSGSLLGTGRHVLTAAHCFTNQLGVLDVEGSSKVFFDLPSGRLGISSKRFFIHPDWSPSTGTGIGTNDIAIIKLASKAPPKVNRYEIYRGDSEVGQDGFKVGYGESGSGNQGAVLDRGEKRLGLNQYDALGDVFLQSAGFADTILPGTQLAYDFDNGSPANDGFGFIYGLPDPGLGPIEGFPAKGDSGGPTFLVNGQIAGIASFNTKVVFLKDGATSDIDNTLNSSFGEFGVDTQVSAYADWIDSTLEPTSVPEPSTVLGTLVFGLGIPALRMRSVLLKRKRKKQ